MVRLADFVFATSDMTWGQITVNKVHNPRKMFHRFFTQVPEAILVKSNLFILRMSVRQQCMKSLLGLISSWPAEMFPSVVTTILLQGIHHHGSVTVPGHPGNLCRFDVRRIERPGQEQRGIPLCVILVTHGVAGVWPIVQGCRPATIVGLKE